MLYNYKPESSFINKIRKYYKTKEYLEEDLGREPLDEEMATELQIPIEEARTLSNLKIEQEENPEDNNKLRVTIIIKNHDFSCNKP